MMLMARLELKRHLWDVKIWTVTLTFNFDFGEPKNQTKALQRDEMFACKGLFSQNTWIFL